MRCGEQAWRSLMLRSNCAVNTGARAIFAKSMAVAKDCEEIIAGTPSKNKQRRHNKTE